jgi:hypothetical protein
MTEFHDPERAAAVRRALDRLLDLVAREIARDLQVGPGDRPAAGPGTPAPAADAIDRVRPMGLAPKPRTGGHR